MNVTAPSSNSSSTDANVLLNLVSLLSVISIFLLERPLAFFFSSTLIKLQSDWRPHNSEATGFWGLLRRTKHLEGWYGLLRGLCPFIILRAFLLIPTALLGLSLAELFKVLVPDVPIARLSIASHDLLERACFEVATIVVGLPLILIHHRVIAHPTVLPWWPFATLRAILTPEERSRPWLLIRSDLFLLQLVLNAETLIVNHVIRLPWLADSASLVSTADGDTSPNAPVALRKYFDVRATLIFAAWIISAAVLLEPLRCIYVRLAVQRPYSRRESEAAAKKVDDAVTEPIDVVGTRSENVIPPVIRLRPTSLEPYTGPIDTLRKMLSEEGTQSIFRGALITIMADVFRMSRMFAYGWYLQTMQ